eukprot:SAG11_NODE_702_length_7661_cov_3.468659_3_plen_99_part_00
MTSGRNWVLTWNNPSLDPPALFDPSIMKYYVAQMEKGAEGTPHIQGYVQMNKMYRLAGMKRCWNGTVGMYETHLGIKLRPGAQAGTFWPCRIALRQSA